MTQQLAGHLLVDCLLAQGVTHAFGVPGESYIAVLDGLYARRDEIQFITCRQEGGAAFMAAAHGKLTGRPGVCIVTRGPGATNASIGVHTAFQDSTPMVLLVGDAASDCRDREAFQEVDYCSLFGPSTKGFAKRVERIDEADRIPEYVARAFATAMNGRPGPVVLVLPEDMLTQMTDAQPLPRVEAVQAWSDPGSLRTLAARVKASDLIIAIGPRLGEMTTGNYTLLEAPKPKQKLVHIHASAEELNRVYQADLAMQATMNAAARSLEVLTAPVSVPWEAWTASCNADYLENLEPQELPGSIDMPAIVGLL